MCVCVRAPLVHRPSWLGCAALVRVLGLGFRLRPATPGWGVGVCVCLCGRSACAPPLLGGVCGVGVRAWAQVSAAPRHSWLGCWGVCVCLCACSACTPPLLAAVRGVGGCAWALVSAAPRLSWLGCWRVCVCVCVLAPLVPCHSWLGCAVWVCVLGLGFRLRPATPGWGVRVLACLCALSACTSPVLAGVCGVGVCAWARVSAAPRQPWLGWRGVCVLVCALRLCPATPGWASWCVGLVLRGTFPCAVVRCVLCALPGFAAPGGRCCLAPVRVP